MNVDNQLNLRMAVLATFIKDAPQAPGRTALMKFAYILQVVRQVPLGYRFELYNYGPYDATLLGDLSQAVTLKAVKSSVVYFSTGYGYKYSAQDKGYQTLSSKISKDLAKYRTDIDWVLTNFGTDSASRLELVSTVIFADRELRRKKLPTRQLGERVQRIKPHFSEEVIANTIAELQNKGLIETSI